MLKKIVSLVLFLALLAGVVLYAMGTFHGEQVPPGRAPAPAGEPAPARTATAERVTVPTFEEAVGTVGSRTRVDVAAQVTARVKAVHAVAGALVTAKSVLVELDDRELSARREQASDVQNQAEAARESRVQARARADAVLEQARKHYDRVEGLVRDRAATPEQLENAEAGLLQAQAGVAEAEAAIHAADAEVERARQAVTEADLALGHAQIHCPIDGVVAMRAVEPGDLAWPGRTLLSVLDPVELRLEAQVREGLISKIERGKAYSVEIPSAGKTVTGTVSEIFPTADPQSRTFLVRVDIPPTPGVHPGMFGRLRVPLGERAIVRIPVDATLRVGQVETVILRVEDRWVRRYVTTGRPVEGGVEVLSGLEGGETIGRPEAE